MIDLRLIAFITLMKKLEKEIITNNVKDTIRNSEAIYKFADYCNVTLKSYTQSKYTEEDQAKIDKFIADNHIEKVKETKDNYAIEFTPSEKAIAEFNKMLVELETSQYRNIAKVASQVKEVI